MRSIRATVAGMAIVVGVGATATTAGADPAPLEGLSLTMTCGGTSVDIVSPGGGSWTPALAIEGNTAFVITSYVSLHEDVYDENGAVIPEDHFEDDVGLSKGQSAAHNGSIECTFSYVDVANPDLPDGYTVVGGGVLTVVRTPRGR